MRPSAAMWRLLPPWQNLSDGAIVSIWPCMPGFHRCSLGLHTSTCTLVKQPAATEAAECRHNYSGQLWFTALPFAIIFSILLVSIAAQDFTLVGTTSNAQLQLPVDQKVHIELPLQTTVTSSWSIVFGKLGRFFGIRRFDPKSIKSNQSSGARPVKIFLHESTSSKQVETEPSQEPLQPSAQRVPHSSSGFNTGLLPDLIPRSRRQSNSQEGLYRKPSLKEQHLTALEFPKFRKIFSLPNKTCSDANQCSDANCGQEAQGNICSERIVHVAMTLDVNYLRGSMAAIYSILLHAECSSNIWFHFVATKGKEELEKIVAETLPFLKFQTYTFDESSVKSRISHAVRLALEEPLNYARFYLAHMIDPCVKKIIYLDSDVLVLDRIEELWMTDMRNSTVGTPEYCHANFPSSCLSTLIWDCWQLFVSLIPIFYAEQYFTENFWINSSLSSTFANKRPCYFNSGMMLINLERWRATECTATLEHWMEVQKEQHIYELGSLPPLLLTFAGDIQAIDHRWNQHGLGGDILKGDCRPTRNEPASLLHWSGGGKPWQRLDIQQPCPVDSIWAQYDLLDPTRT